MSVSLLNYKVEIDPQRAVFTFDNAEIGLYSGMLVWVTNYDATYTPANSKAGILHKNWAPSINKSVIASRKGNTSVTGGGTINLEGSTNLFTLLDAQNVSLYNSLITISESRDGGAYQVIQSGIVTQNQDDLARKAIPFQNIEKGSVTTITKEIEDSGEVYLVNIGNNDKAKTVVVDDDFDIPTIGGRVPVFEVVQVSFDVIRCTVPYADPNTSIEMSDWIDDIRDLLTAGNNIALVQGTKKRIISGIIPDTATALSFTLEYGDSIDDPILVSSAVEDYLLLEPIGTTAYSDFFDGQFNSTDLNSYINGNYEPFPQFIDQTRFEDNAVQLADQDGSGWVPKIDGQVATGATGPLPVSVTRTITGDFANITDGNPSTFVNINLSGTLQIDESATTYFEGYEFQAPTIPESLVVCGTVKFKNRIADDNHTRRVGVYGEIIDQFGNSGFSLNTFEVITGTEGDIMLNSYPLLFGNNPTKEEREGFLYGSDAIIPEAGVDRTFDLTAFSSDIVWKSALKVRLYVEIYDPSQLGEQLDIDIEVYDLRVFAKTAYSTNEIYCDWQGRQNYAGTDYIKTLPQAYEHAIQLQNYQNRGIDIPDTEGWGQQYPVVADWTDFYDDSTNYGGVNSTLLDQTETYFQIFDEAEARTDKVKQKIARLLWAIGATDRQGQEKLYPMIEGINQDNGAGVQITYADLVKGAKPTFMDRKYEDIFPAVNIGYAYDAGSDKNSQSIVVSNVDRDSYEVGFVTGVTDEITARELWDYGRVLYKVHGQLNKFPTELQDCGWITNELQAIEYIRNCYKWQGIYVDGESFTGKQRYIANFRVPYTTGIDKGLDVGVKIQLSIPNKTWDGPVEVYHTGIITKAVDKIGVDTPYMNITAEMLGGNLSGSDRFVIVKGTDSETHIVTGTDSETIVVKGTV